jgi:hypothetical protein
LKSLIAILLSAVIVVQSASKLIVLVNFELNKGFIIAKLCENMTRPKMRCNGKCHLKKQLQKEDKKEKQQNPVKDKSELQFFSESFIVIDKGYSEKQETYAFSTFLKPYSTYLLSVFHPPPFKSNNQA